MIAVMAGVLRMAERYVLFKDTVLPVLSQKIISLFNYYE